MCWRFWGRNVARELRFWGRVSWGGEGRGEGGAYCYEKCV